MRIRRRNVTWLAIIGSLVAIALLSGIATPLQSVVLLLLYAVALAASVLEIEPARLAEGVQRSSLARMRMSQQAQEAVARAVRRGSSMPTGLTLLDVGLITTHSTSEGMVMRRSRAVSLDDDGVRPFITLNVGPQMADMTSIIRFEIIDHNGQQQYVHETRTYLRDGEMNILADHQLPLADNDRLTGAGDSDLRVYIDGMLVGALSFTVSPSVRERTRQFERARGPGTRLTDEDDEMDELPVSLEDLLRSRDQSSRNR